MADADDKTAAPGDETPPKQRHLKEPWKPGQSGNPNGRPKGARSRLSEGFIAELAEHWQANGKEALDRTLKTDPAAYVRVVASLVPKQIEIKEDAFGDLTDEQLAAIVATARAEIAVLGEGGGRASAEEEPQPPGDVPAVH